MMHHLLNLILQHAKVFNRLGLGTTSGSAVPKAKLEKSVSLTKQILECRWWNTPRERFFASSRPYEHAEVSNQLLLATISRSAAP